MSTIMKIELSEPISIKGCDGDRLVFGDPRGLCACVLSVHLAGGEDYTQIPPRHTGVERYLLRVRRVAALSFPR